MKIHAPLLPLAACIMIGIALSGWLDTWSTGLIPLALAIVTTLIVKRYPRIQTISIGCCVILIGMILGRRHQQQLDIEWPTDNREWKAVVISEPKIKEKVIVFDALSITGRYKWRCSVLRDKKSEQIQLGNGLVFCSQIKKIHEWQRGHFSYRRYLLCHGYTGEAFIRPHEWQSQVLPLSSLSKIQRIRLRFLHWRHQLLESFHQWDIDHEASGVIAAMTLGDKNSVSTSIKDTYSRVGAAHILALSGLHLMIIYSIINMLIGWHRWRITTQVITVIAIWGFALLTGLSTSVTRAAFIISIYALLSLGYRDKMSINTLAFTAIVMLIINPYAMYDVSFQLSFMAVLGIILFHPLINSMIPLHIQQRHRLLHLVWGTTTISVAAQIGTAPFIIYYFERFSTWFLLSNYIVVPMASIILYLVLLCVSIYWWSGAVGYIAMILSWIVVTMNKLLSFISQLPLSSIEGIHINTLQLFLLYVIIGSSYVALSIIYPRAQRSG